MSKDEIIADLRVQVADLRETIATLSRLLEMALENQPQRPMTSTERSRAFRARQQASDATKCNENATLERCISVASPRESDPPVSLSGDVVTDPQKKETVDKT